MMSGTIRDNITYGMNRAVSEEEIREAAGLANIDTFIEQLPHQYDSRVGERGVLLSGGQKQRIAIARALLRNSQYLLLDEATASLDSDSEQKVQTAIEILLQGRTSLIIAHRLSTIMNADKIIVIEKGRISGMGTHAELFSGNDYYQRLVKQQFNAPIEQAI